MTTYLPNGTVESDPRSPEHRAAGHAAADHQSSGKGTAQATAEQVRERIGEQSEALMQRGAEVRDQVGTTARQLSSDGADFVRQNPGLALAGALGLGLVIGLSMRNRY
jgi:ElaB/YqjD/DUF883 family membrane-anchored ribosome-binding protein